MSQQILFDLDDTLIYCNRYFFRTIDRFAHQLVNRFNDPSVTVDAVRAKQSDSGTALMGQCGFRSGHSPHSTIATSVQSAALPGAAVSASEKDSPGKLGIAVYARETETN